MHETPLPAARIRREGRWRRWALVALVVALLAAVTFGTLGSSGGGDDVPALAEAAVSPDGRLIAFTALSGGDLDLFVVDAAGRRPPRRVAGGEGFEQDPIWSPDGSQLLFTRADTFDWSETDGELWVVRPDGSRSRRLLTEASDPQWSPDGRRVVAVVSASGAKTTWLGGRLTVVRANGGARRLLEPARRVVRPQWSPDGRRIAFWSGRPARGDELLDHGDLYVVPIRGGGATRLTSTADIDQVGYVWAPGGGRLAVVRDPELTRSVLETIDLRGRRIWRAPGLDVAMFNPSWSRDGRRIAVAASAEPVVWDGERRVVIDRQAAGGPLLWSADGLLVAHDTTHGLFDPIDADVVVARADGSSAVNVTRTPTADDVLVGWLGRTHRLAVLRDERELWVTDLHGRGRRLVARPR